MSRVHVQNQGYLAGHDAFGGRPLIVVKLDVFAIAVWLRDTNSSCANFFVAGVPLQ